MSVWPSLALSCRSSAMATPQGVAPAAWIIAIDSRTEVPAEITSSITSTRPRTGAPTSVPPSPSAWQQLRYVTLPALAPMLLMVSILTMAGHFQIFAEPYVMTQGGPAQRTVTVLYFMYDEGFKWWSLGSASAVAFVLFAFMFAFTLLQLRVARYTQAA